MTTLKTAKDKKTGLTYPIAFEKVANGHYRAGSLDIIRHVGQHYPNKGQVSYDIYAAGEVLENYCSTVEDAIISANRRVAASIQFAFETFAQRRQLEAVQKEREERRLVTIAKLAADLDGASTVVSPHDHQAFALALYNLGWRKVS